ncbi:MAG: type I-E CRISPR-associated protein Cse1/CasA [Microthrixaceae bacterium]|nr:type I-E CRISPR-associated protein Cse1/CasA [Microthrixaceae bacterium]
MTVYFNLLTDGWVRARYRDGSTPLVGLERLIRDAPSIVDLDTDPPILYAPLLRFLVAIVLRAQGAPLGDPDPVRWARWGEDRLEGGPDHVALDAYRDRWADRFWLLHPTTPFLQDPRIAVECPKSSTTNKLLFERASGNNPLWWSKTPDAMAEPVNHATAAAALVVHWAYGAGGFGAGRKGVKKVLQSPLRAGTQYLLRGDCLWDTLLANCVVSAGDHQLAGRDRCWWERDDPDEIPAPGPLARLTGSPRGLLLVGDDASVHDAYVTWGASLPGGFWEADPYSARRVTKGGDVIPYRLSPARQAWADSPALLAHVAGTASPDTLEPPATFDASRNPLGHLDRFWALGATVVTHFPDQSKDIDWARVELPGVVACIESHDQDGYGALCQFCLFAQDVDDHFRASLRSAGVPSLDMWEALWWHRAEARFWRVISERTWESHAVAVAAAAQQTLRDATVDVTTPRRMRTVIRAEDRLIAQLRVLQQQYGLEPAKGAA